MPDLFIKGPMDDFSTLAPKSRFGSLRIWFAILVIVGLLAMLYVGYKIFTKPKAVPSKQFSSSVSFLFPTAYAQGTQSTPSIGSAGASSDLKQVLMVGLFCVLALILLASVSVVFFGRDPARVSAASDVLKTVLGFFIGAATGLLR